ncbi:MAG: malto-oligosyltrehalose trehalohydrolase [Nitriliruptoraceae bacterium]
MTTSDQGRPPGAHHLGAAGTHFEVWAPRAAQVEVVLLDGHRTVALEACDEGYHRGTVADTAPGDTYHYRLHRDDHSVVDRPDPASRHQPQGVHGPSAIDDPRAFAWSDHGFALRPLHDQVIYELHVGTFSPQGTFDGVVAQLDHLVELGATAIELLPVAQFPGGRNWGYDGVLPYAVQDSYGGPDGLRRLVDAAHGRGLAVFLDVVYNHLGPEGNHLDDFGPYFSTRYATPWGPGLNTDGPDADPVRRFVVEHAVSCIRDHHLDGLRLDAVHGIVDTSAVHLLEQLATAVETEAARLGRRVHLIAESDLCDPRLVRSSEAGGYGLDAQWADDLHHAVHVALTGERDAYYRDYVGLSDLRTMLRDRYVLAGRYSHHRRRTIGRAAPDVAYDRFVACVQNHDQVGNRRLGERLGELTDLEGCKLAAATLLTAPFVPMLFMGEEYAEPARFGYFVSHTDPDLVEAVRRGRREEFAAFDWQGEAPDPQAESTFLDSRIDVRLAQADGAHGLLFACYRELIALRRDLALLRRPDAPDPDTVSVPGHRAIALHRVDDRQAVVVAINAEDREVEVVVPDAAGDWKVRLATADTRFGGPGPAGEPTTRSGALHVPVAPRSAVVLEDRSTKADAASPAQPSETEDHAEADT